MTDQRRRVPSDIDVRSGKTLKLNSTPEPEEPITRRIPVQSVAKQRIILLARDMRNRLSSGVMKRALGESTLRGWSDINETLERLSTPKQTKPPKLPNARVTDYRGADPFKAEVARALGRTEVCYAPPADAVPTFGEEVTDATPYEPHDPHDPHEPYDAEVSPFARTTESLPPPELEHLRNLHEEARRSLTEPEPELPADGPEPDLDSDASETEEPKLHPARLILAGIALLTLGAIGNWPLSTQLVQANLSGYSGAHELTSAVAGRVAKVLVAVGDHVSAGQPVLDLEQPAHAPELPAVDAPEIAQLKQALHAGETRVEAQRGVVVTLETKRDRLMDTKSAPPSKLSAIDDLVDAARGQLRALESELLRTRQALDAKQPVRLIGINESAAQPPAAVNASHSGIVVHVLTVSGATLQLASPILSVLGDAAVPALIVSCSEQEAELLLESGEVVVTLHDTKLTVVVTRVLEQANDDGRRTVELALHDTAQLAELATHAEIGMPVAIELPEQRTLFSRASRWLRQEFR